MVFRVLLASGFDPGIHQVIITPFAVQGAHEA